MNFKRLIIVVILTVMAVSSSQVLAEPVNASAARMAANSFIKSHSKSSPGSIKAPAMSDIVLAHAEPSPRVANANAYYIFNIKGGGFVIVSGDDTAAPVLGYSDKGMIDVNNMSEPLQELLDGYKQEIDYLLTHKIESAVQPRTTIAATTGVEPLVKTTWGPEEPYNWQCPTLNGVLSKVGCVAVCMAQTIYFWKYPAQIDSLPAYWSARLSATVPALPPTTIDYSKLLLSYCHWDASTKSVVQDAYTQEQVDEVAKLCRYCGQAVKMNYSPTSSGGTVGKMPALKAMGYSSKAANYYKTGFSDEVWDNMMRDNLNRGIPILYAANSSSSVGHAFIVDGYDNEGYYHMNFGWYGTSDGWFLISSINFTNRYGEPRNYYRNHSMILGMEPPLFCDIDAQINANRGLLMLGEVFNPQALGVNLNMSYRTLPFMFSLTDEQGTEVALSESVTLNRLTFENGSDISLDMALPQSLPEGSYHLHLNYRSSASDPLTQAVTAQEQLNVLGRFAKFGAPFSIADVVEVIDLILSENPDEPQVGIADVTLLIDHLLDK